MTQRYETETGPGGRPRHPRGAARRPAAGVPRLGDPVPEDPRHPRGPAGSDAGRAPNVKHRHSGVPRHPQRATSRPASPPDAGDQVSRPHDHPPADASGRRHRHSAGGGPSNVHHHPRGGGDRAGVPPPAALRPLARALVALALGVRADGLGIPARRVSSRVSPNVSVGRSSGVSGADSETPGLGGANQQRGASLCSASPDPDSWSAP